MSVFSREWVFADRAQRNGGIGWRQANDLPGGRSFVPEAAQ